METYKLFKLYEQKKQHTLLQLEQLFNKEIIHYPNEQIVAIRYRENEHTLRDILDKVVQLDVSQAMFLTNSMIDLILHFSQKRHSLSFNFTNNVNEEKLSIINGYLKRAEYESNELLRMEDIRHLLLWLRELTIEDDTDIKALSLENPCKSFIIYNNGIVKVSSKESLDQIIEISFQK